MNYPNKCKKSYHKIINYANRGMSLEELINNSNNYYLDNDIAIIYKKPTPIGLAKVSYQNGQRVIEKGFFKEPSTLDYNGIYKGYYVDFDAKETTNKTAFPLANIHPHQLTYLTSILRHGGIAFLIININNEYYILPGNKLIKFIQEETRKSIPYTYIKKEGILLHAGLNPQIDYIKGIDILIKEKIYENNEK